MYVQMMYCLVFIVYLLYEVECLLECGVVRVLLYCNHIFKARAFD